MRSKANSFNIEVLFKNENFVAIDKPVGLSVHNNEDPENLLSLLEPQFGNKKLYPVHRLDKETSGVQLLALSSLAAKKISEDFRDRKVKKTYVGLLRGQVKKTSGRWEKPLTDKSEGRKNPAGRGEDRYPCQTIFKVLESSQYFSFCEFNLITGRQHQIRKHSALANHALVGDPRYGDKKYNEKIVGHYGVSRMFLHCRSIEIFEENVLSPTPDDFSRLISAAEK